MMMNNLRGTSSRTSSCAGPALVDPGIKKPNHFRRKRLELRRLKSWCLSSSHFAGEDEYLKKTRFENGKTTGRHEPSNEDSPVIKPPAASLTLTSTLPAGDPPGNDVAESGTCSSYGDGTREVRENCREVTCPSHGSVSVIGRRRTMEDAVTVELGFVTGSLRKYDFYGVYDGHGGSRVAHACRDRLHWLLVKEVEGEEVEVDWDKVLVASFGKMDEEVVVDGGAVSASVGSTAVVAVVGAEVVVVANCGDSRAVLSRGGVAVALSSDHKAPHFVAISRGKGDHYLKPYVISRPEVTVSKRTSKDEFLILASDGLWDVISNEVACQVVRRCLAGRMRRSSQGIADGTKSNESPKEIRAAEGAAVLAELAMARGSKDNISVIVVELKNPGGCTGVRKDSLYDFDDT
ncbi:hypothetical protein RJ639_016946 [Escallonia herrerae]|uniref:protein-serine/threonine phosphatase n=1 Tax=Escallonia herrerae TaxID=1293975 RepID=A0AA88VGI5_9ASTE|nr:hypothetical protein RJ639_016946 [Escallonia herrerae]